MTTRCRRRRCAAPARAVPVVGDADRAAMDRLQRPSQHGLLQCDVRPRHRRIMAASSGSGPSYMKERHGSTFTAECHVRYLREIHLGDPVQVSILLVDADEKRLHTFEELRHATEGWLSATSENMTIHIDMTARKTAPFPPDIRARIEAVAKAQQLSRRAPRASAEKSRCPRNNFNHFIRRGCGRARGRPRPRPETARPR